MKQPHRRCQSLWRCWCVEWFYSLRVCIRLSAKTVFTGRNDVTLQETWIFINTAVIAWNLGSSYHFPQMRGINQWFKHPVLTSYTWTQRKGEGCSVNCNSRNIHIFKKLTVPYLVETFPRTYGVRRANAVYARGVPILRQIKRAFSTSSLSNHFL